jgi:hypothetical protein
MEANSAALKDTMLGKWFFPENFEPNGLLCDNAYIILNADGTAIHGMHKSGPNGPCTLYNIPGSWRLDKFKYTDILHLDLEDMDSAILFDIVAVTPEIMRLRTRWENISKHMQPIYDMKKG